MSRMLSLAVIAAMIIPSLAATAQDADSCQKCPNCQTIEVELVGVEIPPKGTKQNETTSKRATSKQKEFTLEVSVNCEIPFLTKLPFLKQVFGHAMQQECDIFVFDNNCKKCCGDDCEKCCDDELRNLLRRLQDLLRRL